MSDEAGKTRRNLVVLASALVTVAFLKVPLEGNLIGAIDLGKVDAKYAWGAALFALCYFALRYLLDPNNRTKLKAWRDNALAEQPKRVDQYVHSAQAAKSWEHWTIDPSHPMPSPSAKLIVRHESNYKAWKYAPGTRWAHAEAHWEGTEIREDGSTVRILGAVFMVQQKLPWYIYALSWAGALRKTFNLDWNFTEYVLPIAWALAAMGICVYQIWVAPGSPFPASCLCT